MNAAEQATSLETTTKIAAVVNLFQREFPECKTNLNPWANDPDTREWLDPESIDLGVNLPAGQTLVQLRCQSNHLIGIELVCFGSFGNERWRFSTIGNWHFMGAIAPPQGFQQKIKLICQEIFTLFNEGSTLPE
jgi:hypothetical protein